MRGCAIKESDGPSYVMPFSALMLVESRIRRLKAEKVAEYKEATGQEFEDNGFTSNFSVQMPTKIMGGAPASQAGNFCITLINNFDSV